MTDKKIRIGIIYNSCKSKTKLHKFISLLQKKIDAIITVYATESFADIEAKTKMAVSESNNIIVAAGGDGTIYGVVNSLECFDLPLAIIPLGTANDLAVELGIDNIKKVIEAIAHNNIKQIDLGYCKFVDFKQQQTAKYFTSTAGLGTFAEITRLEKKPSIIFAKKILGNVIWPLLVGICFWLQSKKNTKYKMTWNEMEVEQTFSIIEICQTPKMGGITVTPYATLDNGILDFYTVGKSHLFLLLRALFHAVVSTKKFLANPLVHCFSSKVETSKEYHISHVKTMSITTTEPAYLHLNGEWLGTTPVQFSVQAKKLKVFYRDK